MSEVATPTYKKPWFLATMAGVLLAIAVGAGIWLNATEPDDQAGPVSSTTTSSLATTTTAGPTTTTTQPEVDVIGEWIDAFANQDLEKAAGLSTESAERYTYYLSVYDRLDPGGLVADVSDVEQTADSVALIYDNGSTLVYDNFIVQGAKVADFDRGGVPISTLVAPEAGEVAEAGDVSVQVTVVYVRDDVTFGSLVYLTVEIDNQSDEELYGLDARLVDSDGEVADADSTVNFSYPPGTISEDVIIFLGSNLSDGGELEIPVDAATTVVVDVPAVG
jgi:hypothetical protein